MQGCLLGGSDRGDITDAEGRIVEPLLPAERGRTTRPSHDNSQFKNGMLHVLWVGCPWRDFVLTGGESPTISPFPIFSRCQ